MCVCVCCVWSVALAFHVFVFSGCFPLVLFVFPGFACSFLIREFPRVVESFSILLAFSFRVWIFDFAILVSCLDLRLCYQSPFCACCP